MGTQLIICVETNKRNRSDYMYIKSTIDHFYHLDQANIKLSPIYMDGKGNYTSKKVKKEIETDIKQYHAASPNNKSVVIICLDCDDYDIKPEDERFISEARDYCKQNHFRFVWFCKDIERVFIGNKVSDSMKKKEAEIFLKKKKILQVNEQHLRALNYQNMRSNICCVLDDYLK